VSGIYYARVLPELSGTVSVKDLGAGKFQLKVNVTDAGDAVSGATASAKGHSHKTNSTGKAKLVISGFVGQHVTVTVTDSGYKVLKASVKLSRRAGRSWVVIRRYPRVLPTRHHVAMTQLMPGVKREDLAPAHDPGEGERIAEEAARRLADAYGGRLRQVVLFGSWARGQAHEESDVDLVVVLDHVGDRATERERIVDALFDLEADSGRAIEAFPVSEADVRQRRRPLVRAALDEGLLVFRHRP